VNDSPVDVWMKHHTRGLLLNFALIGAAILAVAAAPFTGGGSTVVAAAAVGALMVTASVTAVQSIEEARTALKNGGYVKVSKNGGKFQGPKLPPYTPWGATAVLDPPDAACTKMVLLSIGTNAALNLAPAGAGKVGKAATFASGASKVNQVKTAKAAFQSFKAASKSGAGKEAAEQATKDFAKELKKDLLYKVAKKTGGAVIKDEAEKKFNEDKELRGAIEDEVEAELRLQTNSGGIPKDVGADMQKEVKEFFDSENVTQCIDVWSARLDKKTKDWIYTTSKYFPQIHEAAIERFGVDEYAAMLAAEFEKEMKEEGETPWEEEEGCCHSMGCTCCTCCTCCSCFGSGAKVKPA